MVITTVSFSFVYALSRETIDLQDDINVSQKNDYLYNQNETRRQQNHLHYSIHTRQHISRQKQFREKGGRSDGA